MNQRSSLVDAIRHYRSLYQEELAFKKQFLELLDHPRAFYRDHLPGHITASGWIIESTRNFTLLTHHARLNKWLQPGGHADGDEHLLAVAEKEAREETGLTSLTSVHPGIFDLDIHPIPARKDFPEHFHYDVRFLFQANMDEALIVSEESHDLAWVANAHLARATGNNTSILRMAEKVRCLP
jgi:8-oxo-dGTP pyrophosphatase MutT (NUDIX family)